MKKTIITLTLVLAMLLGSFTVLAEIEDPISTEGIENVNDEGPPEIINTTETIEVDENGAIKIERPISVIEDGILILSNTKDTEGKLILDSAISLDGGILKITGLTLDGSEAKIILNSGTFYTDLNILEDKRIKISNDHHLILDKHDDHFDHYLGEEYVAQALSTNDEGVIQLMTDMLKLSDIKHGSWFKRGSGSSFKHDVNDIEVFKDTNDHLSQVYDEVVLEIGDLITVPVTIDGYIVSDVELVYSDDNIEATLNDNSLTIKAIAEGSGIYVINGVIENELKTRAPSNELRFFGYGKVNTKVTPPKTPEPTPTPEPPEPEYPPFIPDTSTRSYGRINDHDHRP